MTTESERVVARLPVIRTCGDCRHCVESAYGATCMHERAHAVYEIDGAAATPPDWCPLRADVAALPAEADALGRDPSTTPACGNCGACGLCDAVLVGEDRCQAAALPAEAGELESACAWLVSDAGLDAAWDRDGTHYATETALDTLYKATGDAIRLARSLGWTPPRPAPPVAAPDDAVLMRAVRLGYAQHYANGRDDLTDAECNAIIERAKGEVPWCDACKMPHAPFETKEGTKTP